MPATGRRPSPPLRRCRVRVTVPPYTQGATTRDGANRSESKLERTRHTEVIRLRVVSVSRRGSLRL
eukprot:2890187-Pyramimonas_sp.AAC.1